MRALIMLHKGVNVPDCLLNVRKVYLYKCDESYILSSRAVFIHQFIPEEEAVS
jgi:hypothetical protein